MRGNEVFQNGQAFSEVSLYRKFDGTAGRVAHQSTHTAKLTNLSHASAGAGVCHHPDRVELVNAFLEALFDFIRSVFPGFDARLVTFVFGEPAAAVFVFDAENFLFGFVNDLLFCGRDVHVEHGRGERADGAVLVALRFDFVQNLRSSRCAFTLEASGNDFGKLLFADHFLNFQT